MDESKQEEKKRDGVFNEEELQTLKNIACNIERLSFAIGRLDETIQRKLK